MNLKLGKDTKLFLRSYIGSIVFGLIFSLIIVGGVLMFGGSLEISVDLSSKVLTILIELVGVLFGLSAIMVALFFDALEESTKEFKRYCIFFSALSFVSFIMSLFVSFILLLLRSNSLLQVSLPIGFAIFGATSATLYIILIYTYVRPEET